MGESTTMQWCHACHCYRPVTEFEILEMVEASPTFCMLVNKPYQVFVRSYTCLKCGTTRREEWHAKWRGETNVRMPRMWDGYEP